MPIESGDARECVDGDGVKAVANDTKAAAATSSIANVLELDMVQC
jgi:hypothetical protein